MAATIHKQTTSKPRQPTVCRERVISQPIGSQQLSVTGFNYPVHQLLNSSLYEWWGNSKQGGSDTAVANSDSLFFH
jgi:hypothetical protein